MPCSKCANAFRIKHEVFNECFSSAAPDWWRSWPVLCAANRSGDGREEKSAQLNSPPWLSDPWKQMLDAP